MTTRHADDVVSEGVVSDGVVSEEAERVFALTGYVLHLGGSVIGVPSIAGLVLNYLKRGEAGPILATHHAWMIRTFWWAVAFVAIGWLTKLFLIGWVVIGLTWVWYVYRHFLGLVRLANGDAMEGPLGHSMA